MSFASSSFLLVCSEGIFGIIPESLTSFSFDPNIFQDFGDVSLSKIHICGNIFDIIIKGENWQVLKNGELIKSGIADNSRVVIST